MQDQLDREWDEMIQRKWYRMNAGLSEGDLLYQENKRRRHERNINHRELGNFQETESGRNMAVERQQSVS